jgi:hypothetical protein
MLRWHWIALACYLAFTYAAFLPIARSADLRQLPWLDPRHRDVKFLLGVAWLLAPLAVTLWLLFAISDRLNAGLERLGQLALGDGRPGPPGPGRTGTAGRLTRPARPGDDKAPRAAAPGVLR